MSGEMSAAACWSVVSIVLTAYSLSPIRATAQEFRTIGVGEPIRAASSLPDGSIVLATDHGIRQVSDFKKWPLEARLVKGHVGGVLDLAVDNLGRLMASSGEDRTIQFWGVEKLQVVDKLELKTQCTDLAFSSDGELLIAASSEGLQAFKRGVPWSVREPFATSAGTVLSVCGRPNSDELAAGFADGAVRRWGSNDGHQVDVTFPHGQGSAVKKICYSPDGKYLVAASDKHLAMINLEEGTTAIKSYIKVDTTSLTFVNNGGDLVSGERNGKIRYWNVSRNFVPYQSWEFHEKAVNFLFERDHFLVAGGEEGIIEQSDLPDLEPSGR